MDSNKLASELLQMYDNLSLEIVVAELSIAARLERDLEYVHQMLHLKNRIVQINPGLYRRADGTAVPMAADGSMTAADVIWEKIRVAHRRFPGLHAELVEDTIIQNYPDTTEANAVFALCSDHVRDCVGGGEARARRDPRQAHRCEGAEIDAFIEIMRQETGSSVRDIRELVDQYWPERDTIRVMLRTAPAPAAVSEVAQATAAASEVAAAAPAVEPHVAASASVSVGAPAQTAAKRSHTASAAPARAPAQVSTGAPVVDAALRSNTTAALRSHTTAVGQLHSPPPPPPGPKHTVTVPGGQPHSPPPPPPVGQPHSPPPPPPATPPVLQLWRGYHCGRCLGSGTFGDVYEATDNKEEAERGEFPYALKTFRCGNAKQLEREYICCQRVWGHPNFVEFVQRLDPLSGEKFPRLLMRRARGGSLEELLRQNPHQPVPVTLRRAMVRQLLSAVRYMHRLQIVHRDIRPANLLLQEAIDFSAETCTLRVCDFADSTLDPMNDVASALTGAPLFNPPEQENADYRPDGRADSYACGVIMFRLATGYLPFGSAKCGGYPENSEQTTIAAVNKAKLANAYDGDRLPPEERSLITDYMQADPRKRAFVRCPEDLERAMCEPRLQVAPMCLRYLKAGVVQASADGTRWMSGDTDGQLFPPFRLNGDLSFLLRAPAAAETAAWAAPCPMERAQESKLPLGGFVFHCPGGRVLQAAELLPGPDGDGGVPLSFESPMPWNPDLQFNLLGSGDIRKPGGGGRWRTVPEGFSMVSAARTDRRHWFSWLSPEEKLANAATGASYTAPKCGALVIGDRGREGLFNNSPTVFELAAPRREAVQRYASHGPICKDQIVAHLVEIVNAYTAATGTDLHLTSRVEDPAQGVSLQTMLEMSAEGELVELRRIADGRPRQRAAGEPEPTAEEEEREKREDKKKLDRYIASNAGYAVISYILGVGDRHLEQLMCAPDGRVYHSDLGVVVGQPDIRIPLKLRQEIIEAMGGEESPHFIKFKALVSAVFVAMRGQAGCSFLAVLHSIKLERDACCALVDTRSLSIDEALEGVERRMLLDIPVREVYAKVDVIVEEALHGVAGPPSTRRTYTWV